MATNNTQFYPLTYSQKRILNIELEHSHSSLCNIGGHVTFEGSIQLAILEQAIQMFIEDNEAVRIQITEIESNFFKRSKNIKEVLLKLLIFLKGEINRITFLIGYNMKLKSHLFLLTVGFFILHYLNSQKISMVI